MSVSHKNSDRPTPKTQNSAARSDERKERCHSKLSDVGLYCLGGLCAVSLSQLFYEDCQKDFRKKALEKILHDLGQPKQTNDSMYALLDGEIMDDSRAFVDSLMNEECLKDGKQPLIADLIALAISDGCYDARMHVLIRHVAWHLRVTWDDVEAIEEELAETLEYEAYVMSEQEMKEKAKKDRNRKVKRYALIGLATVGGGALIGLTGGLAAPLVAAGAGAVIGGAGAAALGSAAGVAVIGSLFGVAGAGLTGYKMRRRVGAVDEFGFEPLTLMGSKLDSNRTVKQLHITIAVTGWINDKTQDFRIPWSALAESKEQYSLRWESKYLNQLGEALDYLLQTGISVATTEALKYTILSGIITAIAWPAALITAAGAIDNPWHVCTQRATEAGKQLAEVLLGREQGNRPVTLIGFSLGARVIFSCLEELAKRTGGEGLIEDVILLGAPVSGDPKYWQPLTKVVAGKIVNGYARGDWLLKFLYRTASVTFRVAGLSPVKWDNRRMHNIDLSDIIDGHGDYIKNLDTIMKAVGIRTKDELNLAQRRPARRTNSQSLPSPQSTGSNREEVNTVRGIDREVDSERDVESGNRTDRNKTVEIEKEADSGIKSNDSEADSDNERLKSNEPSAVDSLGNDRNDIWDDGINVQGKSDQLDLRAEMINEELENSKGMDVNSDKSRENNNDNEVKVGGNKPIASKETSKSADNVENAILDNDNDSAQVGTNIHGNKVSYRKPNNLCVKPKIAENIGHITKETKDLKDGSSSGKVSVDGKTDSNGRVICKASEELCSLEIVSKDMCDNRDEDSDGCSFTDSNPESEED